MESVSIAYAQGLAYAWGRNDEHGSTVAGSVEFAKALAASRYGVESGEVSYNPGIAEAWDTFAAFGWVGVNTHPYRPADYAAALWAEGKR